MTEQNIASNPDILACQPCFIKGKVTFGKGKKHRGSYNQLGCVIHPGVSILADNGPIIIGDYNIIEERTLIQNKGAKDTSGQFIEAPLEIGNYNIIEMGSTIEYSKIGSFNKLEHKCIT